MSDTALEAVLRRDRVVVIVALALITALAWADLAWLSDDMAMGGMDMTGYRMIPAGRGLMMPADVPWQPIEFGYVFVMWVVMMIGMMMPSAAPMILIYARGLRFFRENMKRETIADSYNLNRVTEVACEFNVRRWGPSHLYTKTAPGARRIFDHQCKTTFATQSANRRQSAAQQNCVLFNHLVGGPI
jgi:hypothetical protein